MFFYVRNVILVVFFLSLVFLLISYFLSLSILYVGIPYDLSYYPIFSISNVLLQNQLYKLNMLYLFPIGTRSVRTTYFIEIEQVSQSSYCRVYTGNSGSVFGRILCLRRSSIEYERRDIKFVSTIYNDDPIEFQGRNKRDGSDGIKYPMGFQAKDIPR